MELPREKAIEYIKAAKLSSDNHSFLNALTVYVYRTAFGLKAANVNEAVLQNVLAANPVHERDSDNLPECPWKCLVGHWKLTDASGNDAEVVWKPVGGDSFLGLWKGDSGEATEVVGWRSDTKELVATGYGPNGEYWEVVFTTVTETMIRGRLVHRTPDGAIKLGIWQVTKTNDNEAPTLFVGTRNGEHVTEKGSFQRVK